MKIDKENTEDRESYMTVEENRKRKELGNHKEKFMKKVQKPVILTHTHIHTYVHTYTHTYTIKEK